MYDKLQFVEQLIDFALLPLGEGPGKRGVAGRFDTQALSPTLSQREREPE
jgi:hypothetical protein